jgi:hypothetical protein
MLPTSVQKQSQKIHQAFNENEHATVFAQAPPTHVHHTRCDKDRVEFHVADIRRRGFTIVENALSQEQVAVLRRECEPKLGPLGRNRFEGAKTRRLYGLLNRSRRWEETRDPASGSIVRRSVSPFDDVATCPIVMDLMDRFLLPNYLLTTCIAIEILPGEKRQPYHHDDQFCNVPRPREALAMGVIFAIDDFTATNGGTIVFPDSHLWGQDVEPPKDDPVSGATRGVTTVMPSGSAIVFLGTLWHGGGGNTGNTPRLALTTQYCQPWMRTQENMMLGTDFEHAKAAPAEVQSLLGYNIHPPFIGHVNGEHPLKRLAKL